MCKFDVVKNAVDTCTHRAWLLTLRSEPTSGVGEKLFGNNKNRFGGSDWGKKENAKFFFFFFSL